MQEAEIEEDAEATRAVDWDKAAADEAYRAQVERAQERQRILMEQLAREVGGPPASCQSSKSKCIEGLGSTREFPRLRILEIRPGRAGLHTIPNRQTQDSPA